jgi:hypothetical protein
MDISGYNLILAPLGVVSAVFTTWYSILEVKKQLAKSHKITADKILQEAREQTELVKTHLESKINTLELEVSNLKSNIERDFLNLKETHSVELKNLSEKIELLREELKDQSKNVLNLLTRLVDK